MSKLISYWKAPHIAYHNKERGFYVIYGKYNHLNREKKSNKCIGLYWDNFPKVNDVLAPMVVPADIGKSILAGLLQDAANKKEGVVLQNILDAIDYFKPDNNRDSDVE
ncbi:hypothetical protein [Proteus hauseri]|uniref:hypothetical protein n=1 Tax=Proteus hauseri TaxID=183417 RepID=UPI001009468F|nr:hypothetical protein [Proteus hauseri]QAV24551.1 hypothetical protein PH4a_14910 [Proteus hauseri]